MNAKEIGARLRESRKAAGKSLQFVADALGCSVQSISQYERGVRPLKVETAQKIAAVLGVPAIDIMGMKNVAPGREEIALQHEQWKETLDLVDTPDQEIVRKGSGNCLIYAETTISAPSVGRREIALVDDPNKFRYVCVPADVAHTVLFFLELMNSKGHDRAISYLNDLSKIPDYQYDPDAES